jgi:hypothetical protein
MKPTILLSTMLFVWIASFTQVKTPEKNPKFPSTFFIGAGVAFNSLEVTGDDNYHETQIDHTSPVSPVFVVGARFYTDKKAGRLFFAPRVSVYSFKAKGDIDLTSGLATYQHASSVRSKIIITPSASLGYHFINKSYLKWYLSAGIGFDFLINPRETQTTTYTSGPPRVVENEPEPMVFVFNMETGIDVGKNISIWTNYQPPADITKYVNKKTRFSSLQVGINWSFSKGDN